MEAIAPEMIDRLAAAIATRLAVPLEQRLWTAQDCADYLSVTLRYFQEQIAVVPSFPDAQRRPTLKGRMTPRYVASEVIAWALRDR